MIIVTLIRSIVNSIAISLGVINQVPVTPTMNQVVYFSGVYPLIITVSIIILFMILEKKNGNN